MLDSVLPAAVSAALKDSQADFDGSVEDVIRRLPVTSKSGASIPVGLLEMGDQTPTFVSSSDQRAQNFRSDDSFTCLTPLKSLDSSWG